MTLPRTTPVPAARASSVAATAGRAALALLAASLAAVLLAGVHASAVSATELRELVRAALPEVGAENPVTGVLLAFRAYDTLLEVGVLAIACAGALVVRGAPPATDPAGTAARDEVVAGLLHVLVPLLLLVAAWLLWAGKSLPGGAFQAGAVLGASGVLLRLAGERTLPDVGHAAVRVVLVAGLVLFLAVGAAVVLAGAPWLGYPPGTAGTLILLIESVLTVSIGASLYALYASAPGDAVPGAAPPAGRDPLDDLEHTVLHEPRDGTDAARGGGA